MTREEEIKARLEDEYIHDFMQYEDDIAYILDRNDELQRRVEKMEAVVDAAKFDRKELHHPECKCHFCEAVDALDAADTTEE